MKPIIVSFLAILFGVYMVAFSADPYTCTVPGRFLKANESCSSYYACISYRGNLIKSDYVCPNRMVFNPATQLCSADAVCINDYCKKYEDVYYRYIPDPNNPNGTTYIDCSNPDYPIVLWCAYGKFVPTIEMCYDVPAK